MTNHRVWRKHREMASRVRHESKIECADDSTRNAKSKNDEEEDE